MNADAAAASALDAIRAQLAHTPQSASTLNLVVWIDDAARRDWIVERATLLGEKHPSLTLILDHTGECREPRVAMSERDAATHVTVQGERVQIDVSCADAGEVTEYVSALCSSGLPTVLWWTGRNVASRPAFEALLPQATMLLVDSSGGVRDASDVRSLAAFHAERPHVALRDLAWLRLHPWQEMIANFFDDPALLDELFAIRRLHIASGSDAEALYLGGWLATRLGWTATAPGAFSDRSGKTIRFERSRDGEGRRVRAVCLDSESSWYHAEVSADDDRVVRVWVEGDNARVARLYPLAAIDNASLIERAVLEPGADEMFESALRSVATLVA